MRKLFTLDLSKRYSRQELEGLLDPFIGRGITVAEYKRARDEHGSCGVFTFMHGVLGDDLAFNDAHFGRYSLESSFLQRRNKRGVLAVYVYEGTFRWEGRRESHGREPVQVRG